MTGIFPHEGICGKETPPGFRCSSGGLRGGSVLAECVWGKQIQLPEETEMKSWDLELPWIIHLIWHPGSGPG